MHDNDSNRCGTTYPIYKINNKAKILITIFIFDLITTLLY